MRSRLMPVRLFFRQPDSSYQWWRPPSFGIRTTGLPMTSNHGVGLHNPQGRAPLRRNTRQRYPEKAIHVVQGQPFLGRPLQNSDLLVERNNASGAAGPLRAITTGPVGMPSERQVPVGGWSDARGRA